MALAGRKVMAIGRKCIVSLCLLLILVLGLSATGCGTSGEPATSQPSSTALGLGTTVTSEPLQQETIGGVLEELPALSAQNLAFVEIRDRPRDGPPLRILSPTADSAEISAFIEAYVQIELVPPWRPRSWYGTTIAFHLLDGSLIKISLAPGEEETTIFHIAEGLVPEGEAMPAAYATAPALFEAVTREINQAPGPNASGPLPADPPADFGFVFAFGVGARNVLDTFTGTFTKDLVVGPTGTATTPLVLSAVDLSEIYDTLLALRIRDYPAHLGSNLGMTPYPSCYLRLRWAGVEKVIRFEDADESQAAPSTALRSLCRRIQEMIEATPEYQALPQAQGGYA